MRKKSIKVFVAVVSLSLCMSMITACGAKNAKKTDDSQNVTTEAANSDKNSGTGTSGDAQNASTGEPEVKIEVPAYSYSGNDAILKAISDYIVVEIGKNFDKADVGIPCPVIVDKDESDPEDILVWGNFWYDTYNLEGDTLVTQAGGSFPGLIHLKSTEAGYEVTQFDQVDSGENFEESAKEIFGERFDTLIQVDSDMESFKNIRKGIIYDFVNSNNLPIKFFKDYGWDPIELEAPAEELDELEGYEGVEEPDVLDGIEDMGGIEGTDDLEGLEDLGD